MDGYVIVWAALSGIAGLGAGLYVAGLGAKALATDARNEMLRVKRNVEEAEKRYLETHRRELAQIILGRSPETFERAFFKCEQYERDIRGASPERIEADLSALSHKYPYYKDFEFLATRHFIGYDDSVSWNSLDQIVDRYIEISKMIILLLAREKSIFHAYGEEEVRVFEDDKRRRADRIFKQRIKDAMALFYKMRRAIEASKPTEDDHHLYEDDDIRVQCAPMMNSPEVAYGIFFKDTREYGVYSFFSDDDRDKTYYSYYRSDRTFREHKVLDA